MLHSFTVPLLIPFVLGLMSLAIQVPEALTLSNTYSISLPIRYIMNLNHMKCVPSTYIQHESWQLTALLVLMTS